MKKHKLASRFQRFLLAGLLSLPLGVSFCDLVVADLSITDGLVVRLDASTISGLADGAEVTSWASTVGGISFANYSDTSKPQYYSQVGDLNNQAALYFDADCMTSSADLGITGTDARTVIAVWADAVQTGSNYQHVLHMGTSDTSKAYGMSVNRSDSLGAVGNHYWGNGFNASIKAGTKGNTAALVYDGTNDNVYVNGWAAGTNEYATNTTGTTTLIGSRLEPGASSAEGIRGYVAEILIYDKALTYSEIQNVTTYLTDKYNLYTYRPIKSIDTTGAQIDLDFDNRSVTGGTYVGVLADTEGGNQYLRVIEKKTGSANNYGYLTGAQSATGTVTGTFDLRFSEEAAADGVSFVLAGAGINVANNFGSSPVGETPSFANSFGIGVPIYNQNTLTVYWDKTEIGRITPTANLKTAGWFTTQFELDFRPGGVGADVFVQIFDRATNEMWGYMSQYVPTLTIADSQLLLRGRTGGATASADFDNIKVLFSNASDTPEYIWNAGTGGAFTTPASWANGQFIPEGETGYIQSGTQAISGMTLVGERNLVVSGGTTTISENLNIGPNSVLAVQNSGTALNTAVIRVGANGASDSFNSTLNEIGSLTINKAAVNASDWVAAGFNCDGLINVVNGGTLNVNSNGLVLGDRSGATGTLNLLDGTVKVSGVTKVGATTGTTGKLIQAAGKFTGTGAVTVGDGTKASSMTLNGGEAHFGSGVTVKNGSTASFNGNTNINANTDSAAEAGYMMIGLNSADLTKNFLTVESGGVASTNKTVRLGNYANAAGLLNVNGSFTTSGSHLIIGWQGTGTVNVDGGTLTANDTILGDNDGGNCGGSLNISNGGVAKLSRLAVGDKTKAVAAVTLDNGTMTVGKSDAKNAFFVGNAGYGSFTMTNNSVLNVYSDAFGGSSASIGYNSAKTNNSETNQMTITDSTAHFYGPLIIGNTAAAVGSLTVNGASTVIIDGEFRAGNVGVGNLTLSDSAQMTVNGSFFQSQNGSTKGGTITIEDDAVFRVTSSHMIFSRDAGGNVYLKDNGKIIYDSGSSICGISEKGANGNFEMSGGTFLVNKLPSNGSGNGFSLWHSATFTQSGGVFFDGTAGTPASEGVDPVAPVVANLNLYNTSVYTLTATADNPIGGTMNVTGSFNKDSGAAFNFYGGTLSASEVNFDLVQNGGVISPGIDWTSETLDDVNIGVMKINGDLTVGRTANTVTDPIIKLEIDAATGRADQLIVTGKTTFLDDASLSLVFDETLIAPGMSFEILSSTGEITGADKLFANMSERDRYFWNYSADGGKVTLSVDSAAVPEPATWTLLILGLCLVPLTRRNRKR